MVRQGGGTHTDPAIRLSFPNKGKSVPIVAALSR